MKLNNKRTILVGLAFLSICAFWQMYDSVVPLILTKTFHMNETFSGAIMAADNILALFLLPFFGSLSDRTSTKIGKRMPFILFGTGCAVILMNILPLLDNSYAAAPSTPKTASLVLVAGVPLFIVVSAIMFVAIAVLFLTIKEPKLTAENQALEKEHPEWNLAKDDGSGHELLPKPVKKSLGFLLASIALWFIGYNGVTTWFSTYVDVVMGQGLGGASTCLLIATAGAIVSYIPIGWVASKIGRKRTIQCGIVLLAVCFSLGYVLTTTFTSINAIMFIVFALVGLAWAAINVNSLPMVVEMCKGSDIGKFTGYYYTASMAAQVVTPVVVGTLMRNIDYRVLFPYAALFVALSFVTMLFVQHGDVKSEAKKGLEAFEEMDD